MIIPNINTLTILEYCCSFLHLLLDTGVIVYSSRPNFILQISFLQLLDQDLFAFLWYIQRNSRASGRMHAYYHHSRGGKPASGENCWNISSKGNCEFSFLEFANFCTDAGIHYLPNCHLPKCCFYYLPNCHLPNCYLPKCCLPNCYLPNLPYQKSAGSCSSQGISASVRQWLGQASALLLKF